MKDSNEIISLCDLSSTELDCLLELDQDNDPLDSFLKDQEITPELIELKSDLDTRRDEYIEFYETEVRDVMKEFIDSHDIKGALSYEARIKRDCSVRNSLERKNIEIDDLKDYLGLRFIAETKEDAYTIAGHLMMDNCIPKGREEELKDEPNRFMAYETRDYFKRPKLDDEGNIQYSGIHIFLEKYGKKFEIQIHDLESYLNANLTHDSYKSRKTKERTTVELELEDLIDKEL